MFLGVVRDHADGRTACTGLTYEAYEEAAVPSWRAVAAEARRQWPTVERIALLHRIGDLELSEASVAVVVSSPHRAEAFDAARFCIDTLEGDRPDLEAGALGGWLRVGHRRQTRYAPSAEEPALSRDLAIDLGTANTLVYARGQGIILNEPTVIAMNTRTHEVLALGHDAWQMIGRTPGYIVAVRPLRGGAITDFEITQRLIRMLFQRAGISRLQRARVLICVPSAITHVEQRAVLEAARRAGAAQTFLIEQPMAAAIGASLPIHEPLGNMVVDIGGGTSEVAVISLGGVVALEAVRVGSFDIDAAIQSYVRREYGLAIGERTAEEVKLAIGSVFPTDDEYKAEVRGRDLMSGMPKTVVLTPEEVREAIDEPIQAILGAVKQALARTPPELSQDLLAEGIHLVGGGAMLRGFDLRIEKETAVRAQLVDLPLETVVLGRGPLPRELRPPQGHVHVETERSRGRRPGRRSGVDPFMQPAAPAAVYGERRGRRGGAGVRRLVRSSGGVRRACSERG